MAHDNNGAESEIVRLRKAVLWRLGITADELLAEFESAQRQSSQGLGIDDRKSVPGTQSGPGKETVDLGPYLLKAMAIRRELSYGLIEKDAAEARVSDMIAEAPVLTDEQQSQLWEWAGL